MSFLLALACALLDGAVGFRIGRDPARRPLGRIGNSLKCDSVVPFLIATHSSTLSRSLKIWIETWLGTVSNRPRALVALMAGSAEQLASSLPAFTYLREVAMRGRMEFFSLLEELPSQPAVEGFTMERLRARADSTSFVLEEILNRRRPEPRWGINE